MSNNTSEYWYTHRAKIYFEVPSYIAVIMSHVEKKKGGGVSYDTVPVSNTHMLPTPTRAHLDDGCVVDYREVLQQRQVSVQVQQSPPQRVLALPVELGFRCG